MPTATRIPRKHLSILEEACSAARLLGQKAQNIRGTLTTLEMTAHQKADLIARLHEIESIAYRTAYEIGQIDVAGDCDGCPVAPATLSSQIYLLTLADTLEEQVIQARNLAQRPWIQKGKEQLH